MIAKEEKNYERCCVISNVMQYTKNESTKKIKKKYSKDSEKMKII
jgi:hypothetical protein